MVNSTEFKTAANPRCIWPNTCGPVGPIISRPPWRKPGCCITSAACHAVSCSSQSGNTITFRVASFR